MFGSAVHKLILLSTLIAPLATGCAATVYEEDVVYVRHRHNHVVFHDAPDLVYIGDGVYVVQDYGTAVYYVDGSYYYNDGGIWYSSGYWNSPWSVAHIGYVPVHIHHRHHDHYVNYHGGHGAHVVKAPSHGKEHHGAKPTHGNHQASAPSDEQSHTKSGKYVANVEPNHSTDFTASKGSARGADNRFSTTDGTRSGTKTPNPKTRAEPPRAGSEGPMSRPSDDDDGPSRSAPTGKASKPSKSPDAGSAPRSSNTSKAPSKSSKKSKPTKKKSRR